MSMMHVPSLAPGARTLPIGLRVPEGNAYGWHRLHGNLAPLTEPPTHVPVDFPVGFHPGMAGLGYYDANGDWQPDESPYPVVMDSGAGTVPYTGSTPPVDWASIIAAGTLGIDKTLAITQGGSVTGSGIYGSTQTANVAAGFPQNQLNLSGAGISGMLSSPMLLIGLGLLAVLMISGKK